METLAWLLFTLRIFTDVIVTAWAISQISFRKLAFNFTRRAKAKRDRTIAQHPNPKNSIPSVTKSVYRPNINRGGL